MKPSSQRKRQPKPKWRVFVDGERTLAIYSQKRALERVQEAKASGKVARLEYRP